MEQTHSFLAFTFCSVSAPVPCSSRETAGSLSGETDEGRGGKPSSSLLLEDLNGASGWDDER